MASSFSFAQFIVSRIVLGLGTGGMIATVSVWQSELSKADSRGAHVSAFGIFCGIGLVLSLWVDFGMASYASSVAWRFPFALSALLSILAMAPIFFLPESPRWLMKRGRVTEATDILNILHGDSESVEAEVKDIELALELSGHNVSMKSLFSMGPQRIFHRVMIAATVQAMLQLTGVNSITYYASTIYETELNFSPRLSGILAAASQFCIILGSCICSFTVDRYGRRTLMLMSAAGNAICFACITGLVSDPTNQSALYAAVFFLFLYYVVYTLGFLGIPFLYASEIAPVHLRAAVCGISTAVSWLFNFLVAEVSLVNFTTVLQICNADACFRSRR